VESGLFKPGQRVAIGASGGKDSTVLAYTMKLLNERHAYGLDLFLLSVDEGITGYRDDSLKTVKSNQKTYGIPLHIVSYEQLYNGWTMDKIVSMIGKKNNCTFCGVFRRQALDRGAAFLKADCIVTGHNADDLAETIMMNVLRGDIHRLARCTAISTSMSEAEVDVETFAVPRSKPFKYTYEKEIVMYAYLKKLEYFSTECIYAPNAYRGYARAFLKDLEAVRPRAILDIIRSGEAWTMNSAAQERSTVAAVCSACGYICSGEVGREQQCKACILLRGLNAL
jgi:cytoplasmic tRNA 2-thiolation protein 1